MELCQPDVRTMLSRMSHRQFHKWIVFSRLHNIDSRERIDESLARLGFVALNAQGVKVAMDELNPLKFRPNKVPKKEPQKARKKASSHGLDPVVLAAFGKSDPKLKQRQ